MTQRSVEELCEEYLPFAKKVAMSLRQPSEHRDDLTTAACDGMYAAAKKINPAASEEQIKSYIYRCVRRRLGRQRKSHAAYRRHEKLFGEGQWAEVPDRHPTIPADVLATRVSVELREVAIAVAERVDVHTLAARLGVSERTAWTRIKAARTAMLAAAEQWLTEDRFDE